MNSLGSDLELIVRLQSADYADVLRLRDASFKVTDPPTFEWQPCQQVESLDKECTKYVYKDDGVEGYAAAYRLDQTHFRLNLIVDPRHRRQGIGTLLLEEIGAEARTSGGKYLQARLWEGMEASLRFALARGFREIHRMRGMVLVADHFQYRTWEGLGQKFSAAGYSLTTLEDEFDSGADALNKLCVLQLRAREGWPSPDPTQESNVTTTEDVKPLFSNIKVPGRFVITRFKDEYVAYTSVKEGPGTAVHPDHRNLGVARQMKAYAIKLGINAGEERFETCSSNPAMQRVNEQLGYKYSGLAEVRLVKVL